MQSIKVSPLYIAIQKLVSKLPKKSITERQQLYSEIFKKTQNLPAEQKTVISVRIKEIIDEIEAQIERVEFENNYTITSHIVVTKLGRWFNSFYHKYFSYLIIGLIGLGVLFSVFLMPSNIFEKTKTLSITKNRNAKISNNKNEQTITSSNVKEVEFRFKFPENLDLFNISQDEQISKFKSVSVNKNANQFNSNFALSTKDFIPINPEKSYLGVTDFKLLNKLKFGAPPPILSIGFHNFDQDGIPLKGKDNYTSFIFSGRLRDDKMVISTDGLTTVSNLIFPNNSDSKIKFPAGAVKFKPFISFRAENTEFAFKLISLSILEIE